MRKRVLYDVSSVCCLLVFFLSVAPVTAMAQSFAPSRTLGEAFVDITKKLIDPLGIVFKDEQQPEQGYGQQDQGVEQNLAEAPAAVDPSPDFPQNTQAVQSSLFVQNGQRWGGSCDSNKTKFLLKIDSVSKSWGPGIYDVRGKLNVDSNYGQCVGQTRIYGSYDSNSHSLRFERVEWMNNPCGFAAISSLGGSIVSDGKAVWGWISDYCGDIYLKLDN